MRDKQWKDSRFIKAIKLTKIHHKWIMENKGKKSAAGYLESLIEEFKKPNLFKKK